MIFDTESFLGCTTLHLHADEDGGKNKIHGIYIQMIVKYIAHSNKAVVIFRTGNHTKLPSF